MSDNNDNLVKAIDATNVLISVGVNSLLAAQKYTALISTARAEGREISDEELAALKVDSDTATANTLALLGVQV